MSSSLKSGDGSFSQRTRVSTSSLHIPPICFGTSGLGNMPDTYGYEVSEDRAHQTLVAIFESDCRFIDTSRNYGFGRSEQRIGRLIKQLGGLPDDMVVSTKLDRDMDTGKFDAARARQSFEQSLDALGLDRVHMLHLHDPEYASSIDDVTGVDGALSELFRIKHEGLADVVGLAAGRVDVMMPLLNNWDFDCLITHNRYTLVNRHADSMMNLAQSRGMSILNAAPFASGSLAKGSAACPRYVYQDATDAVLSSIRQFEAACDRHGVPIGAAALQFSLRDERIASTICGITAPQRVDQIRQWANWPIGDDLWQELASLPFQTDDPEASREYRPG